MSRQWWLALLGEHGNPTLLDGPHHDRDGVEKAKYLLLRLGMGRGRNFACAEVILTDVEAESHGANEDVLKQLNAIGIR